MGLMEDDDTMEAYWRTDDTSHDPVPAQSEPEHLTFTVKSDEGLASYSLQANGPLEQPLFEALMRAVGARSVRIQRPATPNLQADACGTCHHQGGMVVIDPDFSADDVLGADWTEGYIVKPL